MYSPHFSWGGEAAITRVESSAVHSFCSVAYLASQLVLSSGKIMFISLLNIPHFPLKYLVLVAAGNVMQT